MVVGNGLWDASYLLPITSIPITLNSLMDDRYNQMQN